MDIAALTAETFRDHVGSRFSIALDGGEAIELELVEVFAGPRARPFSLWFRGPGRVLPQRIYRMEHPALGTLDLFIVPRASDGNSVSYEAVFN